MTQALRFVRAFVGAAVAEGSLRNRTFAGYVVARASVGIANTMLVVALGWHLYQLTGDPWSLAWVGLMQILPVYAFFFVSGMVIDYIPRVWVVRGAATVEALALIGIAWAMQTPDPDLWALYALVAMHGAGRAFHGPALQAIVPNIVHTTVLDRAVAVSTTVWNSAMIAGPALAGFLIAWVDRGVYGFIAGFLGLALLGYSAIPVFRVVHTQGRTLKSFLAGLSYVWRNPVLLGGLSVDVLMVGLGSVFVLLPIYAVDILQVGPELLGVLRAAPAVGSITVGLWIAASGRELTGVGRKLFWALLCFAASILVFATSTHWWLSLAALFVYGASDMISVNIRSAMVHRATPEALRGRVSAVNMLFIQTSNEAGDFRGGAFAATFGAMQTAVLGGLIGFGVLAWSKKQFPALYRLDKTADLTPLD